MSQAFSLPVAEATARDYLARAQQADINDPQQLATAYGWLTQVLANLLDSVEAERTRNHRPRLEEAA